MTIPIFYETPVNFSPRLLVIGQRGLKASATKHVSKTFRQTGQSRVPKPSSNGCRQIPCLTP
jgi:hypothetical protein